ncbi:MAG: winged helix-turn-helix transcriptional regulator [Gammaproteobacteria bacterium]|nr:winged helix-turn-helix transcriptional regulator [Gammaproteobacteria bacterium]
MNDTSDREARLTLELLDAIERRSDVSQRHLARQMGVALGLANSYLKRCAKKGFVKIREAPANRYLYYLTPKGFAEKARLTGQFLSTSLTFYRQAGEACTVIYLQCVRDEWTRLILCGVSDLAEIAYMRALESQIDVVGVFDPSGKRTQFFGKPVWQTWNACGGADAFVITEMQQPLKLYNELADSVDTQRILVPSVLGIDGLISGAQQQTTADQSP